jgi:hypothetical protein
VTVEALSSEELAADALEFARLRELRPHFISPDLKLSRWSRLR